MPFSRRAFLCATLAFLVTPQIVPAQTPSPVERQIAAKLKRSKAVVGFTAVHIETGQRISVNGDERFPMASVYKFPIALHVLRLIDQGRLKLDQMIPFDMSDLRPGVSNITKRHPQAGMSISIREMIEEVLKTSDNAACDKLLKIGGGPEAVTQTLASLGIRDMNVSRPEARLGADSGGYTLPPESEWTPEILERAYDSVSKRERMKAVARYEKDPRDTSTPDAMVNLLMRVHKGELLKRETNALLVSILENCETGKDRLKGLLPTGTVVAHKTGTMETVANDVGIVTLPDGAGHVAVAVFTKSSREKLGVRERIIAEVSRDVYDHFLQAGEQPKRAALR